MTKEQALSYATDYGIPLGQDYHALSSAVVDKVQEAAKAHKYREPKGANGSRTRYFYAALCRAARRTQ